MSIERKRETVDGALSQEWLQTRLDEGWRPVAVEWERESSVSPIGASTVKIEIPFGLEIAPGGDGLQESALEMSVLRRILADLAEDRPLSEVAAALNGGGLAQRNGRPWTQSAVFELLPRVIEVAPEIYDSEAWRERRRTA